VGPSGRSLGHWGVLSKEMVGPQSLSPLSFPDFVLPCSLTRICHHKSKTIRPIKHEQALLKLWSKIHLFSFCFNKIIYLGTGVWTWGIKFTIQTLYCLSWLILGICYSKAKLTNTETLAGEPCEIFWWRLMLR
jgi:hypothetical protein